MDFRPTLSLLRAVLAALALLSTALPRLALADTYNLPSALTGAPFNCLRQADDSYRCPGSITLDKDTILVLSAPLSLSVDGNFTANKNFSTAYTGAPPPPQFNLTVGGNVTLKKDISVTLNLISGAKVDIAKNARFTGDITAGSDVTFAKDSRYFGNVTSGARLTVGKNTTISGICRAAVTNYPNCGRPPTPIEDLNHVRLDHTGSGLTCTPASITVRACGTDDDGGVCNAVTSGVSGTVVALDASGNAAGSAYFNIPPGSSAATVQLSVTTAGPLVLDVQNQYPDTIEGANCWNGSAESCLITFADAGLLFDVPSHVAETAVAVPLRAVRKVSGNPGETCGAALSDKTVPVQFSCGYSIPSSGTLPLRVNDLPLNASGSASAACDGNGRAINLQFDVNGRTSFTARYADAGKLLLNASLSANNATLSGSDSFVARPARFAFSATSAAPLKAGDKFATTIMARNSAGAVTPNFGREPAPASDSDQPLLSFKRCAPTSAGAVDGNFSSSALAFSAGIAQPNDLIWTEVGQGDLTASRRNYLEAGLDIYGSTGDGDSACAGGGKVGPFIPHHYDVAREAAPPYAYSGQPLSGLVVRARNAAGGTTVNFDKTAQTARKVTLKTRNLGATASAPGPAGALDQADVADTAFTLGEARPGPAYAFTLPPQAPTKIRIRAEDQVYALAAGTEAEAEIRSGRLRLSNAFGNNKADLKLPLRAEYWSGQVWTLNNLDNTTALPYAAVAVYLNGMSGATVVDAPIQLTGGQGAVVLRPPKESKGYIDIALNLGGTAPEQSCLNQAHASNAGAQLPWLRSRWSCAASYDRDPSARASYGANGGESKANVHTREVFN